MDEDCAVRGIVSQLFYSYYYLSDRKRCVRIQSSIGKVLCMESSGIDTGSYSFYNLFIIFIIVYAKVG